MKLSQLFIEPSSCLYKSNTVNFNPHLVKYCKSVLEAAVKAHGQLLKSILKSNSNPKEAKTFLCLQELKDMQIRGEGIITA